jgi:chemotaxis protein methyltransferase CheR
MPASPTLALLAERIAAELGLYFDAARLDELRRGLAGAAQDFGFADEAECVQTLLATPWTEARARTLAAHLTVGETYFFRDPPLLDAFSGHILPELLQQRRTQGRRRLRIWSAGCCTGEEPYTLAMLIDRALPDRAGWDIAILATDINPRFLEKARAGRYGEWSFRGVPAGLKERYFRGAADGRFEIDEAIRRMVTFAELNLARDTYPCTLNGTDAVDVIFCRNLLMYFGAEHARAAQQRLERALGAGGWLVVSPSEASSAAFPQLDAVNFESAVVFRKPAPARAVGSAAPTNHPQPAPIDRPELRPIEASPAEAAAPRPVESSESARRAAWALADQGHLEDALAWCERWIAADKLDPWAHYVSGVVLVEQGEAARARDALRRCVYLQPDFVLAHLALGHLARGLGDGAEAARCFAAANELRASFRLPELEDRP